MPSSRWRKRAIFSCTAIAVSASLTAGTVSFSSSIATASANAVQLSLIVSPHLDDEYSAWSLIQHSPSNYPVFIYVTEGEDTSYCSPGTGGTPTSPSAAYSPASNERFPGQQIVNNQYPFMKPATPNGPWDKQQSPLTIAGIAGGIKNVSNPGCRMARMNSARQFIGDLGNTDPTLPQFWPNQTPKPKQICFTGVPEAGKDECAYYLANNVGAEIFFDLGDDNNDWTMDNYAVSPNDVIWAIQRVIQNRATIGLPNLPVHNILGAAFYNSTVPGRTATTPAYGTIAGGKCALYSHWNHRAVQVALFNNTILAGVFNTGRTCSGDPDAQNGKGRTNLVDPATARTVWSVSGDGRGVFRATGSGSNDYGWLDLKAFPYTLDSGFGPNATLCTQPESSAEYESEWSCVQAFWIRGGAATVTKQY